MIGENHPCAARGIAHYSPHQLRCWLALLGRPGELFKGLNKHHVTTLDAA